MRTHGAARGRDTRCMPIGTKVHVWYCNESVQVRCDAAQHAPARKEANHDRWQWDIDARAASLQLDHWSQREPCTLRRPTSSKMTAKFGPPQAGRAHTKPNVS